MSMKILLKVKNVTEIQVNKVGRSFATYLRSLGIIVVRSGMIRALQFLFQRDSEYCCVEAILNFDKTN